METIACDLCGSVNFKKCWTVHDRLTNSGENFTVVECIRCGLVFVNPRPTQEEILRYYPEEYAPYHRTRGMMGRFKRFLLRGEVRRLKKIVPGDAKILDVGSGGGEDAAFLRDCGGWKVEGVDVSEYAARQGKAEFGLTIHAGTLEALRFPDASYDVVRMKYVMSHVHSPRKLLKEVYRILKPGGRIFTWIPNFDSLNRMIFNGYWEGGEAPRHLYDFGTATISRYLMEAGFSIEKIRHSVLPNTSVHSFRQVLLARGASSIVSNFFTLNIVSMVFFFPLSFLALLVRRSDRLAIRARKL